MDISVDTLLGGGGDREISRIEDAFGVKRGSSRASDTSFEQHPQSNLKSLGDSDRVAQRKSSRSINPPDSETIRRPDKVHYSEIRQTIAAGGRAGPIDPRLSRASRTSSAESVDQLTTEPHTDLDFDARTAMFKRFHAKEDSLPRQSSGTIQRRRSYGQTHLNALPAKLETDQSALQKNSDRTVDSERSVRSSSVSRIPSDRTRERPVPALSLHPADVGGVAGLLSPRLKETLSRQERSPRPSALQKLKDGPLSPKYFAIGNSVPILPISPRPNVPNEEGTGQPVNSLSLRILPSTAPLPNTSSAKSYSSSSSSISLSLVPRRSSTSEEELKVTRGQNEANEQAASEPSSDLGVKKKKSKSWAIWKPRKKTLQVPENIAPLSTRSEDVLPRKDLFSNAPLPPSRSDSLSVSRSPSAIARKSKHKKIGWSLPWLSKKTFKNEAIQNYQVYCEMTQAGFDLCEQRLRKRDDQIIQLSSKLEFAEALVREYTAQADAYEAKISHLEKTLGIMEIENQKAIKEWQDRVHVCESSNGQGWQAVLNEANKIIKSLSIKVSEYERLLKHPETKPEKTDESSWNVSTGEPAAPSRLLSIYERESGKLESNNQHLLWEIKQLKSQLSKEIRACQAMQELVVEKDSEIRNLRVSKERNQQMRLTETPVEATRSSTKRSHPSKPIHVSERPIQVSDRSIQVSNRLGPQQHCYGLGHQVYPISTTTTARLPVNKRYAYMWLGGQYVLMEQEIQSGKFFTAN